MCPGVRSIAPRQRVDVGVADIVAGETIVGCAVRELREETGIALRCDTLPVPPSRSHEGVPVVVSRELSSPLAFAAADAISRDDDGNVLFHYAIIEASSPLSLPYPSPAPLPMHRRGCPPQVLTAPLSLQPSQVAGVPEDPDAPVTAADDAADARWVDVVELDKIGEPLWGCARALPRAHPLCLRTLK